MKRALLLLSMALTLAAQAEPYKIVVVADLEARTKAAEFKEYLRKKPPFSRMKSEDLEIKIVTVPKDELDCSNNNPASPRIISCDTRRVSRLKASEEAHMAMVFTSTATGGSGGSIPKASTDYPTATMFHEMLHTYGFDDEYTYSHSESGVYCRRTEKSANVAYFHDHPPYTDDADARRRHTKDVEWMGEIPVVKRITQGTALGSPSGKWVSGRQVAGLYRGGPCDLMITSWRPYENSIMRGFADDTVYPLYEDVIIKSIEASLGRRLELGQTPVVVRENKVAPKKPEVCAPPSEFKDKVEEISSVLNLLAY